MSTKNIKNSKEDNKLTKCKNCRQDIISEKMFLHEGFCHRNNVFCEHCKKVFLKEDYEKHIKDLPKNLTSENKGSPTNSKKSTSNEEEPIIIKNSTTINPNPSLQFIQMPLVEEYTINAPIIISENGQILSDKNKNEYILPFLGINTVSNKNIFQNDNSFQMKKQDTYTIEDLKEFLNLNNECEVAKIFEMNNNQISQNNIPNNINFYNNNNQLNELNCDNNYKNKNIINVNNYNSENNKEFNSNNIIYNNILIYNKNKNKELNKNKNSQSPKKKGKIVTTNININNNYQLLYPKDKDEIIPNYRNNRIIEKSPQNRKKRINCNNSNFSKSKSKEPKDSKRKILTEPRQCVRKNYKEEMKNKNISDGKKNTRKLCEYCKIMVEDLASHYNICKSKQNIKNERKNKNIGDNVSYFEILDNHNIDEYGIEDNKKQILNREFVSSLQPSNWNSENMSSEKIYSLSKKVSKIKNEEIKTLNVKKLLFPKMIPLKLKKERKMVKEQKINYKENKMNKINKNENPKSVNKNQKIKNNYLENSPSATNRQNRTAYLTDFRNMNDSGRKEFFGNSKDSFNKRTFIRI